MNLKQNKSLMKFRRRNICINYVASLLVLLMLLHIVSCNNIDEKSKDEMESMDNKKMSEHDMMGHNMKDMDISKHNMDSMNKSDSTHSNYKDSMKLGSLVLPANYRVVSAQRSIKQIQQKGTNEIKVQGYISIDERRNFKVASKISGRIEKLFVKYDFQYVKKGEKIMEIYSPELNTYQEELLFLMKNNTDSGLVDKAEKKLILLGVTQTQINEIKKNKISLSAIDIYSPQNGYVFFKTGAVMNAMKDIAKNNIGSKMNNMGNNDNRLNATSSGNSQIREGDYINKGDVLFWINDLDIVLGMIAVDNSHQQELKTGAKVSLISELYKKDTINGEIDFIEPVYQLGQNFMMSRIYIKNPENKYKINSLIDATVNLGTTIFNVIPSSSILSLGKRKIVWVLKEKASDNSKIYEARDVVIGLIHNGMVEIKKGLHINEEVAIDAGYLLDRESLIEPN